jgi:hypothetical protein
MKKRVSISNSTKLLREIDRAIAAGGSRSVFIEEVLWDRLRREIGARDILLINANADCFNREMEDVLRYQADIFANEPSPL